MSFRDASLPLEQKEQSLATKLTAATPLNTFSLEHSTDISGAPAFGFLVGLVSFALISMSDKVVSVRKSCLAGRITEATSSLVKHSSVGVEPFADNIASQKE